MPIYGQLPFQPKSTSAVVVPRVKQNSTFIFACKISHLSRKTIVWHTNITQTKNWFCIWLLCEGNERVYSSLRCKCSLSGCLWYLRCASHFVALAVKSIYKPIQTNIKRDVQTFHRTIERKRNTFHTHKTDKSTADCLQYLLNTVFAVFFCLVLYVPVFMFWIVVCWCLC